MPRKHKHEEHQNHEAWAIPYGDLITLLLAFFVVMYAVSSINEGKYRVLSDSMAEAFGGPPKSIKPLQFGTKQQRGSNSDTQISVMQQSTIEQSIGGISRALQNPSVFPAHTKDSAPTPQARAAAGTTGYEKSRAELRRLGDAVEQAMGALIAKDLVVVRRTELWLEVEIRADILFPSGVAQISATAIPVLDQLAAILKGFPNELRIEGHTDNVPIFTRAFPSNWELSAARAASVVHLFMQQGVDPLRMTVVGRGQFQPAAANDTAEGRNRNRRVVLVVMGDHADDHAVADPAAVTSALQPATNSPEPGVITAPAGTLAEIHASPP